MSLRKDLVGNTYGKLKVTNMLYKYKNKRTYCKCICECGSELILQTSSLVSGNTKSCGCINIENLKQLNAKKKNKTKKKDKIPQNDTSVKYKYDYTNHIFGKLKVIEMLYKYRNGKTYCRCLCECGNETITLASNLKRNIAKSCGCQRNSPQNNSSKTTNLTDFKIGKITVLTPTHLRAKNGNVIWNYICECGNYGVASGSDIRKGSIKSCGCFHLSQYESHVMSILDNERVNYLQQFTFSECKNIRKLPFDFYLPEYNICIECQGQQHYYPVDFFGGVEKFNQTCKNDKIKLDFCSTNEIMLICLPYSLSTEEIEKIILNKIKSRNDYSDMGNHTHTPLSN